MTTKDEQLIFRCFRCKKNYEKNFNKELIQRFASTYEFCNGNLNRFILLLRKGAYPYECMDSWQRSDETSLPDKEAFYSNLTWRILQTLTICMQKEYSKILVIKIWVIIMIYMFKVIQYCLQMFLEILLKYMT